jgi:hypothetical protein
VKTRIKVSPTGVLPAGLVRADLKIVATSAAARGRLLLGDCDHPAQEVARLAPGARTTTLVVGAIGRDGRICVTSSVDVTLDVSVRAVWTSAGDRVAVSRERTVFDSAQSGRYPSRSDIYKVRFDGSAGVPAHTRHIFVWIEASSDTDAVITAGPCGAKRVRVAAVAAGDSVRTAAWVKVNGKDLCIGASAKSAVKVDVLAYG